MKLLLCRKCGDVFSLSQKVVKTCSCESTSGQYIDKLNAWYKGEFAIPLGFDNQSFKSSVLRQPNTGWGMAFDAFVIEKDCKTFIKK